VHANSDTNAQDETADEAQKAEATQSGGAPSILSEIAQQSTDTMDNDKKEKLDEEREDAQCIDGGDVRSAEQAGNELQVVATIDNSELQKEQYETQLESQSQEESTSSAKKMKANLQNLESPLMQVKSDSGGRAKRNRKQPNLYDPQTVPARAWVSDGVQYPSHKEGSVPAAASAFALADANETDMENLSEIEIQDRRRAKVKKEGHGDWCNFCSDDLNIPLCCFCACRYCYSKHDQAKVLLCDTCNDEYHVFCLDPPPAGIVPSQPWYCPQCSASRDKRTPRTTTKRRIALTKSIDETNSGPQRRSASPRRSPASNAITTSGSASEKRGPGRPRKNSITPTTGQFAPSTSTGKRRGRPAKTKSEPPRKRGRPPKGTSLSPPEGNGPRNKARLSDPSLSVDLDAPVYCEAISADPVTVSRSGRPVKRSSFHDEVGRGEQHLRAFRDQQRRMNVGFAGDNGSTIDSVAPTSSSAAAIDPSASYGADKMSGIEAPTPANTPMHLLQLHVDVQNPTVADTLSAAALSLSASFDAHGMDTGGSASHDKERMQMSRRLGARVIGEAHMETLLDYCQRGKVEHLIRMRERLDDHARFLELQLAGLESAVKEKGESDVVVPAIESPVDEDN
jgi:hypothetical protein